MFCPRCGDLLTTRGQELWCERGGMGLSVVLADALKQLCNDQPDAVRTTPIEWGGTWHCPADGSQTADAPGQLPQCAQCGRVLPGRVLYQLIERHPHA